MKPKWYSVKGHELENSVYLLSAHALKSNQYVKLREGLAFIERHRDGSWICYVRGQYVGFESSAQYAAARIEIKLREKYNKVWYWRPNRSSSLDRKGQRCRVLATDHGALFPMNSQLIEFEDGYRAIVSRYATRKLESVQRVRSFP